MSYLAYNLKIEATKINYGYYFKLLEYFANFNLVLSRSKYKHRSLAVIIFRYHNLHMHFFIMSVYSARAK